MTSFPGKIAAEPQRREVTVYDGAFFLGRIVIEDKAFTSFDVDNQGLSVFKCQRDAMAEFDGRRA